MSTGGHVLVDSTVLSRLVLGGKGADFAVNLFARAEEGAEEPIVHSVALVEALSKAALAAAATVVGASTPVEAAQALNSNIAAREKAADTVEKLSSYLLMLEKTGRLLVYSVSADDIARATELMKRHNLHLSEAITLAVAEKLKVSKIATFSERLRRIPGYTYLPQA